jgi:hypothetical protein
MPVYISHKRPPCERPGHWRRESALDQNLSSTVSLVQRHESFDSSENACQRRLQRDLNFRALLDNNCRGQPESYDILRTGLETGSKI